MDRRKHPRHTVTTPLVDLTYRFGRLTNDGQTSDAFIATLHYNMYTFWQAFRCSYLKLSRPNTFCKSERDRRFFPDLLEDLRRPNFSFSLSFFFFFFPSVSWYKASTPAKLALSGLDSCRLLSCGSDKLSARKLSSNVTSLSDFRSGLGRCLRGRSCIIGRLPASSSNCNQDE